MSDSFQPQSEDKNEQVEKSDEKFESSNIKTNQDELKQNDRTLDDPETKNLKSINNDSSKKSCSDQKENHLDNNECKNINESTEKDSSVEPESSSEIVKSSEEDQSNYEDIEDDIQLIETNLKSTSLNSNSSKETSISDNYPSKNSILNESKLEMNVSDCKISGTQSTSNSDGHPIDRQLSSNNLVETINPALTPVKKGEFYEHDNRDHEEKESSEIQENSIENSEIKKSMNQNKKIPSNKDMNKNSSLKKEEDEKWRHDKFEKQFKQDQNKNRTVKETDLKKESNKISNSKIEKENKDEYKNSNDLNIEKKSNDRSNQSKSLKYDANQRFKPSRTKQSNDNMKKNSKDDLNLDDSKVSSTSVSKGLSLSEYLEQDSSPKNSIAPNKKSFPNDKQISAQTYNESSNNKNKYKEKHIDDRNNESNKSRDLHKRLDFSTRKPITSDNFDKSIEKEFENEFALKEKKFQRIVHKDEPRDKLNLKITANYDLSKRFVTEDKIDDRITNPEYNNFRQQNRQQPKPSYNSNIKKENNLSHQIDYPVVNKDANFVNTKNNAYDEYYFKEDEHEAIDLEKSNKKNNNRPKYVVFDNNLNIDQFNNHKNNRSFQNQQYQKQDSNYNEYIDYSIYSNDQHDFNDPIPINRNSQSNYYKKPQINSNLNNKNLANSNYSEKNNYQSYHNNLDNNDLFYAKKSYDGNSKPNYSSGYSRSKLNEPHIQQNYQQSNNGVNFKSNIRTISKNNIDYTEQSHINTNNQYYPKENEMTKNQGSRPAHLNYNNFQK